MKNRHKRIFSYVLLCAVVFCITPLFSILVFGMFKVNKNVIVETFLSEIIPLVIVSVLVYRNVLIRSIFYNRLFSFSFFITVFFLRYIPYKDYDTAYIFSYILKPEYYQLTHLGIIVFILFAGVIDASCRYPYKKFKNAVKTMKQQGELINISKGRVLILGFLTAFLINILLVISLPVSLIIGENQDTSILSAYLYLYFYKIFYFN